MVFRWTGGQVEDEAEAEEGIGEQESRRSILREKRKVIRTMNLRAMKWALLLSGVLMFWSCGKDDVIERFVEPSLQTYFDRFADEAAARNVTIDFDSSNVSGYIRLITEPGVIGQCAHNDNEPNTVIIDKIYFDKSNDLQREFVVFHELGHCVLNRDHLDDADNNGNCISIMTSGVGQCNIIYNINTRSKMLDELFMK